jgi:hypothetical protein
MSRRSGAIEQYGRHPKPRSAGIVRALTERGNEREVVRCRPVMRVPSSAIQVRSSTTVSRARWTTRFREAIDQARPRYVAGLVLAEVDYVLRNVCDAMRVFMQDLARGAFTCAPPTLGQLSRAMEVDRRFAALGLGLVDGSIVARRVARHLSSGDARRAPHRRRWWFLQRIPTVPDSQSAS